MYDSICEAINLYYTIMEVYEKAGGAKKVKTIQKIRRDMPLDEVFFQVTKPPLSQPPRVSIASLPRLSSLSILSFSRRSIADVRSQYALAVGDGSVRSEVEQRCRDHAEFLLAHFHKETEFKWEHTSFCRWMESQYPVSPPPPLMSTIPPCLLPSALS